MEEGYAQVREAEKIGVPEKGPSHVEQAGKQLAQEVEQLNEAVVMLGDRLSDYLRSDVPMPERPLQDDDRPVMIGPAERLRGLSDLVSAMTRRVHAYRDQFEG